MISLPAAGDAAEMEGTADDLESESSEASVFQMLTEWQKRADEQGTYRISRRKSCEKLTTKRLQSGKYNFKWGRKLRGGQRFRQIWALLSGACILQDCFSIPLLAFGRGPTWLLDIMEAVFWTVNIPVLAWFLSIHDSWNWREVILACLVETILVCMLYVELLTWVHSVDVAVALLRGLQLGRVLHLPRLYDWAGLARPVSNWMHRSSREVRALVNMLLSMVLGLFFLHVLTCLSFAVRSDGASLDDLPMQDQYRITLETAMGRLHPVRTAENMLLPTQLERVVALLASGSALLFGSMFASLVTNDLADIRRVRRQQKETVYQVSDYLTIFPIPWDLEKQCKEFLRTKMAGQAAPCKAEIAQLLPDFLRPGIRSEGVLC
ncbi:unnamed protein product [Symbiodinium natans]|uniref:Ion transport domain-containing protein n=1 Tax=Symbiodinium natans TaxID=878477 RepID=A0A812LH96_9DINO|nr:unnamed protein product [Symbiodinium natans]